VDELVFSPYSIRAKAWAGVGENQGLSKGGLRIPAIYAIVAMSREHGLAGFVISEKPIVKQDALNLLSAFEGAGIFNETVLFWDNLRMHHSKVIVERVAELGWTMAFNAPYSSAWHCIEAAFAQVKAHWRKQLISRDFELSRGEHWKLVEQSLRVMEQGLAQAVEQRSFRHMQAWLEHYQGEQG
jgi:hypothetical protein